MNELKQKRDALLHANRDLAMKVKTEARAFTPEERTLIDNNMAEAEGLLQTIELARDIERAAAPAPAAPLLADGGTQKRNFSVIRTQDGRECRMFSKGQNMADATANDDWLDLNGLGQALAGTITGNRRGIEAECRALSSNQNSTGGFFITEQLSGQIIDMARNKSRVFQAGVQTMDMPTSDVRMIEILEDPTIAAVAENAQISTDDPSFGSRLLVAKKHGVIVKCSNEVLSDGVGVGTVITNALASAFATYLDSLVLTYLFDEAGVGTTGSVGQPDWDDIISARSSIHALNGEPNALLYNPTTAAWYAKLKESTTLAYLQKPESLNNLALLDTNQIASTKMILGDFTQAVVGVRAGLDIQISSTAGTSYEYDQSWIRLLWRGDTGIFRKHFNTMTGLTY